MFSAKRNNDIKHADSCDGQVQDFGVPVASGDGWAEAGATGPVSLPCYGCY